MGLPYHTSAETAQKWSKAQLIENYMKLQDFSARLAAEKDTDEKLRKVAEKKAEQATSYASSLQKKLDNWMLAIDVFRSTHPDMAASQQVLEAVRAEASDPYALPTNRDDRGQLDQIYKKMTPLELLLHWLTMQIQQCQQNYKTQDVMSRLNGCSL